MKQLRVRERTILGKVNSLCKAQSWKKKKNNGIFEELKEGQDGEEYLREKEAHHQSGEASVLEILNSIVIVIVVFLLSGFLPLPSIYK